MGLTKRRLWVGLFLSLLPAGAWAAPAVVTDVQVKGTLRVEPGLVLQKVKTKPGEPYDPARVREDVRAIYALGYFQDVLVDLDAQGRLVFLVAERPAVRDWKVEGSKAVDAEEINKAVTLKKKEIPEEAKIDQAAKTIRDLFREKGYYLVDVRTEIVPVADGKNQVDVIYKVSEGEKVRLKDLNLLGVSSADEQDLRKYISLSPVGFWSWISGSGTFKETDLERDREVIRSYYLNHGFAEAKVLDPLTSMTSDRQWLKVDIPITEGVAYNLGKITFAGDLEFPEAKLRQAAALKEGDLFRSDDFRKANQNLTDLYGDIGYAFVDVDPVTKLDRANRTLSIEFQIKKGDPVHIGRIEIKGNTKTRDRIIRREMRLAEGDLYNGTDLRKSRRKIENLGYFEKINITTNRRPGTNLVDIDIEVEEKATGSLSVGAGYSSVDQIIGMASVSQRNFLGLGYQLAANANFGSRRQTYSLTFNNPRVFDSNIYAGTDIYKSRNEYPDYDKDATGADLKFGTQLSDDWRIRWIYRIESATVSNIDKGNTVKTPDNPPGDPGGGGVVNGAAGRVTATDVSARGVDEALLELEGKTVTSSIRQILTYDTRDNPFEPHSGALAEASVELAGGPLGGTAEFAKYDFEASKYIPLWWKHVLTLHTQAGYIHPLQGSTIPIYERYALGGINSIRGFANRSVGEEVDGIEGGRKMVLFNAEYLFPILEEAKIRGVLFFDAGNAWWQSPYFGTGLRTGAGFGIRWFSPMGPLRLEYGYNLDPKPGEAKSKWEFSIGGFF